MRENLRNLLVGLTSIIAMIGMGILLMSFGELDPIFHPRYKVSIVTNDAAGLRPGGPIEFSGVPVGVIDRVDVTADREFPVHVVALIDSGVKLPANVQPHAFAPLIGGSATLQLQPPSGAPRDGVAFLPDDNTAVIRGPIQGGMFSQLSEQLDQRMKPLSESLEKFNKLSETYIALGENLNTLLKPQTPEQVSQGEAPNLRTAVIKLNQALDEAREGLEIAKTFLGDESMRADARNAVRKANELIERATTAVDRYSVLAESLQTDSKALVQKLLPVADQLGATLEEVRRLTKLANEGKGTVGQLLNNPDLYKSLNDAAARLEQTLQKAQLLIGKIQQEGLNINF